MQEVFFCREGATESVSKTFKGPVPLDSAAFHHGVATGSLQLQTQAAHFSTRQPSEDCTLEELLSLCGPTAGTTVDSPIVVRPAPSAGERQRCSAEVSLEKVSESSRSQKSNCECRP